MISVLVLVLGSLALQNVLSRKVWNTRFAYKGRQTSLDITETLCRNRDLRAEQVLGDNIDSHAIRDVMSVLVDKGDQQRFLEVLNMLPSSRVPGSKVSPELDSQERDDMGVVMMITSFIKGFKKVTRSLKQGQQLIHAASGLKGLVSSKGLLLFVMALNITLKLNVSGDYSKNRSERKEEDEKAMDALREYTFVTLKSCLQDFTQGDLDTLIVNFRSSILLHCPYDNFLRLRSSLLQRPRDQVTYTHALNGLGMVDAMVRDKRVELLTLLVLRDVHSRLLTTTSGSKSGRRSDSENQLDPGLVIELLERVSSGEMSHAMYVEASQLLDTLAESETQRDAAMIESGEGTWRHGHYESAVETVRGTSSSKGLGFQRQLEGGDWRSCKRLYGSLLEGAIDGVAVALCDVQEGSVRDQNFATLKRHGSHSHVLVVGDGDLSFSASLLKQSSTAPGGSVPPYAVTATVIETAKEVRSRYTGSEVNIAFISSHPRGSCSFEVDATNLSRSLPRTRPTERYDTFIFNYPFADAGNTVSSRDGQSFSTRHVAVGRHQALLSNFLRSVREVAAPQDDGHEVHVCVSLLSHQALAWDLEQTASDVGFALAKVYPFNENLYRALGYKRRRSYSDDPFRQFSSGYATNVVEGWVFVLKMDSDS
jgi:hypothetical protein